MDNQDTEIETTLAHDAKAFEEILKVLWDKVRAAAGLVASMREEKQSLQERLLAVNNQLEALQNELHNKEQEIRKLRADLARSSNHDSAFGFSNEEREILRARIRELIAKINSHL